MSTPAPAPAPDPNLVDAAKWDMCGFEGTALGIDESGEAPPFLGCVFRSANAAKELFTKMSRRVGGGDERGELRISIVESAGAEGVKPGYAIHISSSAAPAAGKIHRVVPPPTSTNLAEFKEHVAKHGQYLFLPIFGERGQRTSGFELAIRKTKIELRAAADVRAAGPGDPDAPTLTA